MNVWQSLSRCTLIAPRWWGKFFIKEARVRRENSPTPANASPHLLQQWPLLVSPFWSIWISPSLNKSATVSDSVPFNKTGEGFTLTLLLRQNTQQQQQPIRRVSGWTVGAKFGQHEETTANRNRTLSKEYRFYFVRKTPKGAQLTTPACERPRPHGSILS